jgi:ribosomal protein S14
LECLWDEGNGSGMTCFCVRDQERLGLLVDVGPSYSQDFTSAHASDQSKQNDRYQQCVSRSLSARTLTQSLPITRRVVRDLAPEGMVGAEGIEPSTSPV